MSNILNDPYFLEINGAGTPEVQPVSPLLNNNHFLEINGVTPQDLGPVLTSTAEQVGGPDPQEADYTVVTRSFAPNSSFGFGFEGNDRGYSTDRDASSKVAQEVGLNLDGGNPIAEFTETADATRHHAIPFYERTEQPEGSILDVSVTRQGGIVELELETELDAENPYLTPPGGRPNPAPSIDVFTDYTLTRNEDDQTLRVQGEITGDDFPATEALIYDEAGEAVFLGTGAPPELASPFLNLPGENRRDITSFDVTINTDADGNFVSIEKDGETLTLEAWNEQFTSQEINLTDPLSGHIDGAIEEFGELQDEAAAELGEAIAEIVTSDSAPWAAYEVLEGSVEISAEILEGAFEMGGTFAVDTVTTTGAIVGEGIDWITPWEGNIPDLNPFG